ncbi:MocR-like pyridoxine biosynthesis transcription factor PdxR [Aneurinibacillus sp. REN35]|uniref:MocR-like pyridoxine biosynthesis transcription factor PdxR n=1 Tax=Aneurinibacillus sp. REN35 TaxID=3237286 RepID=UPI00352702D7
MLWIPLDRSLDLPLLRQVYEQIREKILSGELHAGEKLPSTRELAAELKVSRNVILEAYDQLLAEGFTETRRGAGTFVACGAYLEPPKKLPSPPSLHWHEPDKKNGNRISFRSGIPALGLFPRKTWAKLSHAIWQDAPASAFGYDMPEGRPELRHVLSHHLRKTRGVDCQPEQLVITSGATQALTLVATLLLSSGDSVLIEDPITNDIQTIFTAAGAVLHPIPVDQHGMKTSLLPVQAQPKFVFVTPSHQFPIGGALPIQRRIQLITYARENNCYLIEDDYDSEFRYEGSPVSSLQGLDPERVIYVGSFSKILSPALRMGYLILPAHLIEKGRRLKWFLDLHTPSLNQLILARFIAEGHLERHIARMKKIYQSRRNCLINCLQKTFSGSVSIVGHATGLHLVIEHKNIRFTKEILEVIDQFDVAVYPVEDHTIVKDTHPNRLILGYGHLTHEEIQEGIARLYKALFFYESKTKI